MNTFKNVTTTLERDIDLAAFNGINPEYRWKIILAHLMIYLFPVIIVALFYWKFPGHPISGYVLGFSVLLYFSVIIETIAYLFGIPRMIFTKYVLWFAIATIVISMIYGYIKGVDIIVSDIAYTEDPINSFLYLGAIIIGIIVIFIWAHIGLSYILDAFKVLYTQKAEAEAEIRFGTVVNKRILEDVSLEIEDIRAYACSLPANELGGDFFELSRQGDSLFASIGDVAGHSFVAGLLMTRTKSALQTHLEYSQNIIQIMKALNQMFLRQYKRNMYATISMLKVIPSAKKAQLCNAGHLPLFHIIKESGRLVERHVKGVGVGLDNNACYEQIEFSVSRGDLLIMFSDGLIETRDENMQIRSTDYFQKLIMDSINLTNSSPQQLVESIMEKVKSSDHATQQEDDITLIVIEI